MTQTPKRFIVRDTTPCYVSWFYEVEADNEDDAFDAHCDGATSAPVAMEVGDSLEWAGGQETAVVEHIPATAINERSADAAPELLEALDRLARAAANRENTQGDPLRLIEVQAELREATTQARAAIAKAKEG